MVLEQSHKSHNGVKPNPRSGKKSIWLSKWRSRSGKQTSDKIGPVKRPQSNPSGGNENGQMPSYLASSSTSSSSSYQRQRHSSPSHDLSSGYLSQTNGSAPARRPNKSERVVAARNHGHSGDQSNLHYVAPGSERLAKISNVQHSHSTASSSTFTRLPMVPMKIDDEEGFVLAADQNNDDTGFNDGQNLAMHDFSHSVHYLDQHPGYLVMIDGSKRRQHHRHHLRQLRQLQQQQQLRQLQIFRQQHQYHKRHPNSQQHPNQFGDKLETAMRFGDSLEHHQHHLLSQHANDEIATVSDECADSDQTLASNQRYRFATLNNNINNDDLNHPASLEYVLAASQNSATLDGYDDQQLDEGDEYGLNHEQLASLAPDRLHNHQLLLFGALGGNHQHWLQPDISLNNRARTIQANSSGGVGTNKRTNRDLPQQELAKRVGSDRLAPPIRAQDANERRKSVNSIKQQGNLLQAMSQNHHLLGSRHDQLGQQHPKLNSINNHHNQLNRTVSNKAHSNQTAAFRPVPKSATSSSLLLGNSKTDSRGANMMRTTSQMNVNLGSASQNSSAGSYHHAQSSLPPRPEPMSCCGRLAKFLLFIANVLFWCTGVALGAWGILTLVEDHKYNLSQLLVFEPNSRMSLFQLLAWSFIILGGATIVIGICGCSALFKNSRWILGLYIFLILAIFALDLATGLLAIIFQERLVTNVRLRLVGKMRNEYGIQASFTAAIDYIQTHYECCGLEGHFDYEQSLWRLQRLGGFEATVARTCCHLRNTLDDQAHVNPRPVNESMCQSTDVRFHQSYRFRRGCLDDLERLIRSKIWTFTVGCGIVGAIILVVLTLATCFCRSIPNVGKMEADRKKSSKSSSRNNNPSRALQQELMYAETAARKQGHHRHGQHDHR